MGGSDGRGTRQEGGWEGVMGEGEGRREDGRKGRQREKAGGRMGGSDGRGRRQGGSVRKRRGVKGKQKAGIGGGREKKKRRRYQLQPTLYVQHYMCRHTMSLCVL